MPSAATYMQVHQAALVCTVAVNTCRMQGWLRVWRLQLAECEEVGDELRSVAGADTFRVELHAV